MRTSVVLAAVVAAPYANAVAPDLSTSLQQILNQAHQGPLYTYPTSLTQGIVPKLIHSHNDYWRDVPFYSAISVGAVSVEADVWLYNGTLHVGHEQGALTDARTFESLYINPILDTLHRQNPTNSPYLAAPTHNGVFDTNGAQTLYLFVDVKTSGNTTWPYVVKALEPLYGSHFHKVSTANRTLDDPAAGSPPSTPPTSSPSAPSPLSAQATLLLTRSNPSHPATTSTTPLSPPSTAPSPTSPPWFRPSHLQTLPSISDPYQGHRSMTHSWRY